MDIPMPALDGIEATRRITADDRLQPTKVLVLTTFDLDQYVYDALRAGASGFLLKGTAPQQLLDAIRVVAEFAARPDPERSDDVLGALTERERDVLIEVARGDTNAEIAARLFISPLTANP